MLSQRRRGRFQVGLVLMGCIASLTVAPSDAEAQRGRRGRAQRAAAAAAAPEEAPQSAAIAPALGDLTWGMTPEQTFNFLQRQIEGTYRERLHAARNDTIQQDRLRQQMAEEVRRVRSSFVRFRGEATGWDTSFVRDEFTHGNNESMMLWRDESTHSQRYYFFINDRLWKVYQAFDASVFQGVDFAQFSETIQGRYGRGVERSGALVEGRPPSQWLEWQDATTRLRAIDQTRFYGFFCLVFEDKATLSNLSQLRRNTIDRARGNHSLVDSVLQAEGEEPPSDDRNADIADRLTGQVRRRTDAPASAPAAGGARSQQPQQPASSGRSGNSDDPFAGMAL